MIAKERTSKIDYSKTKSKHQSSGQVLQIVFNSKGPVVQMTCASSRSVTGKFYREDIEFSEKTLR